MAGRSYEAGPQLPNYMKKQMKRTDKPAASTSAKAAAASPARKSTSSSTRSASAAKSAPSTRSTSSARSTSSTRSASNKTTSARAYTSAGTRTKTNGARSGGTVSKGAKKRKKDSVGGVIKALFALAGVLVAVIAIIWIASGGKGGSQEITDFFSSRKTFKEGVKLIGVDVSGLTAEEATGLVKNAAEKKLKTVEITVRAGEREITLDSAALGMTYSIEKALEDGIAFGRDSGVTNVAAADAGEFDAEYIWSREAIELALANIAETMNVPAVEPYAQPILDWESEERFTFVEGVQGMELNIADTADAIEYALRTRAFDAKIDAVMSAVLPTKTVEEVKAVTQLIASFTTKFSAARNDETKQNRKFNIKKASDIINGYVVQPGEVWSFNTVVGPRTYELGWKGANGISGGKEYTTQAGGGICQVSTTLYNALLCSNMEIVYRRAHSIPSDYVEKGLDATVDTNGIDFNWKNNTEYPVYVFARVASVEGSSSRNTMTVYIYGAPLPEGVTYKARSVVIEVTPRTDTIFTQDPAIATGYQKELVLRHDGFVAEAYLDKYVNGEVVESVLLNTDKYKGNPAEIAIGTGPVLDFGAVPPEDWQLYGTPPTEPAAG